MTAEASTTPDSITQIATPEQLKAAREARGWSMSDIAAKLGMMPRQIDAIEHGRWDALPGQAFMRGAIRAYGKALQLDVAPLLATLGAQAAPELRASSSLDSPLPRHGALGFDHGGSGSRIVWILLGVIGVIAIAMYFGRGADLGQVLEPGSGTPPGRAVDVVPLTPGASSPGGGADAARDTTGTVSDATRRSGAAAGSGETSSSGVESGGAEAAGTIGTSSASTDTADPSGTAFGPRSAASLPGTDAPGASPSTAGASSATGGDTADGGASSLSSDSAASASAPSAATDERVGSTTSPTAATPAAAGGGAVASSAAATSGGAAASEAAASEAAALGGDAAAASDGASARADALVMRFERESWVEVRDATGRVLLLGTQPANSTRELLGEKPYSMTIGNAPFVRVEHGGRNVDLGAVTQKGVARVRVE